MSIFLCFWHEKMYNMFENMTREGPKPLIEAYTTLLDCYKQIGDTKKLIGILKMIMHDDIKGTRVTINILVNLFSKGTTMKLVMWYLNLEIWV